MELTLIRHTSVDVPPGYCYGQTDVPLRDTFAAEAETVKKGLEGERFDRVYTSPLSRCTRLAGFCGYPDAVRDERMMELNFGEWEMVPFASLTDRTAQEWFADWIHTPAPGGESLADQYARVSAFLNDLRESGAEKACVFTHGGAITCARVYAGEYEMKEAFRHIPAYGERVKLTL